MAIDCVVFDLGNVLVPWDRRFLFEKLIEDAAKLDHFLDEILTLDINADLDRGVPLEKVTAELSARHPEHADLIDAFRLRWPETLGPIIEESVAILVELTTLPVTLLALSNWGKDTFAVAEPHLPFLRHFEGLVISGREGVVKPDPAIFELLCRRHDVTPERTVFIDDSAVNVETAVSLGFEAVHFRSPPQCRAALVELGLALLPSPS